MPEQQLTEEDLKNMSPEEIKELAKRQCIFCQIISGKVSSKKIYEDEHSIAILDINPANPGHVLIMPKEHYALMPSIPDDIIAHLGQVTKHISQALLKALKVQGTYIFIANGVAAGQKAQHFMIHVIPRKDGDGLALDIPENAVQERQLEQIRSALIPKIGEVLQGIAVQETEEEKEEIKPVIEAEFEEKGKEKKEEKPDLDAISALVAARGVGERLSAVKKAAEKGVRKVRKRAKGGFVSSATSQKYHTANCPFAKKIKAKKRVYFKNKAEAKKHKKKPCGCVA